MTNTCHRCGDAAILIHVVTREGICARCFSFEVSLSLLFGEVNGSNSI